MKPAADAPDSQITEKTIRTRIVPVNEARTPDLWDYLRNLQPMDWPKHMVYGYRTEPAPKVGIFKCSESLVQMPNGKRVQVADEQEMEFALQENFGGGVFRIMVKNGPQIVTAGNIAINAPARAITIPVDTANPHNPGGVRITSAESDVSSIAGKAIDAVAGQEHQAVRIGMEALGAAANVVRSFSDGRPGGGDDMTRQFMAVMMARLAQDPMEQMVKFFTLMREMTAAMGGTGNGSPLVDKLLGAAVDRFMNPQPAGAPVSPMAELTRQFPTLGAQAVEGLREFRLAREAEARIVSMQRTGAVPVAQPNPQVLPAAPPQPAAAPAAPNGAGAPTMEFIEQKIIFILQQPNLSAEQAADEVMSFLTPIDPQIVDQLAKLGVPGLVELFQKRPILRPATNNMPRLLEFLHAFMRMHAEDVAAEGQDGPPKPIAPHGNA